jgi:hypothetical protein
MTACEMVETSRQLPDSGYVTLDRAPVGWLLQVDEAEPVPLQGMSQGVRYALPAGRHRIRLLEGPEIRYDRFIFVSAGQVVPVEVPR